MVVARTLGLGGGFLKFELEPGWTLKRRQYGSRRLGHIYLYRDDWPGSTAAAAAPSSDPLTPAEEPFAPAAEGPIELPSDPEPFAPAAEGPIELPSEPAPADGVLSDF
jgi:hypothetical protein